MRHCTASTARPQRTWPPKGRHVTRVVLDYELKADYQRFLNRPDRPADATLEDDRAAFAAAHGLTVVDGHLELPDLRLEYEGPDGERGVRDVELVTEHYSRAQLAGKAAAGFAMYRASRPRRPGHARRHALRPAHASRGCSHDGAGTRDGAGGRRLHPAAGPVRRAGGPRQWRLLPPALPDVRRDSSGQEHARLARRPRGAWLGAPRERFRRDRALVYHLAGKDALPHPRGNRQPPPTAVHPRGARASADAPRRRPGAARDCGGTPPNRTRSPTSSTRHRGRTGCRGVAICRRPGARTTGVTVRQFIDKLPIGEAPETGVRRSST